MKVLANFSYFKFCRTTKRCDVGDEKYEYTIYSSCCNLEKGIYYYRTYDNSQITAVDMNKENLEKDSLIVYQWWKHNKLTMLINLL